MEKRIELEKRRRSADQLYELILDNCRSTSIEGLTDEFVNLRFLSLIGVGLTNLKGFPKLAKLRKLELSDNRIAGGLHILKDTVPRLTVLNLSNNKIKDLETLEPLKELPDLKSLDLYRNEITQVEDYREKIFELLPGINFVDSVDREGKDVEESDLEDEELKEMNGTRDNEEDSNVHDDGADGEEAEDDAEEEEEEEGESDDEKGEESESGSSSDHGSESSVEANNYPISNIDDGEDSIELAAVYERDLAAQADLQLQKFDHPEQDLGVSDDLGTLIASPNDLRRGKKRRHDDYVDSD